MVRPRSLRGGSIHQGNSPASPSPGSEYDGSGSGGVPATPPDSELPPSSGWFSPGGTASISTRELAAAAKGRISVPPIQTNNLGQLLGAGSSSGSLRPSTPTPPGAHRASAWSAPPSIFGSNGTSRPTSFLSASASSAAGFDNTHLRLGDHLSLMSHGQTLQLYRANARKATDPQTVYELAVFMVEAAQVRDDVTLDPKERQALFRESFGMLRKIADRGHVGAQYYLAECMAAGVGSDKANKKPSMAQAHAQYILAAKHGHSDAAYKAGRCYEKGWGCIKDNSKAVQWLRKAGAQGHAGALYRLGTAELNGELGRKKNAKEGIKYLKLSAQVATREWPQALHELALIHDRGISGVVFPDPDHACELLARAAELGYAPSAYLLGQNYEYGKMGCAIDGGLSVHMYNIAAQQNHKESCFALTAWYLVGVPGILPQSDTEAFLWAAKAAEQGLAKAEYAMGYFCEMGIGTPVDQPRAKVWYSLAIEHGDQRAGPRLNGLRSVPMPPKKSVVNSPVNRNKDRFGFGSSIPRSTSAVV